MTTTHVEVEEHEHDHPTDAHYVKIALILGFLTALEVSTYFFDISTPAQVAILFPMMFIKFAVVAAYFMHLKYDNHIFRRVFVGGIILATVVYLIALSTMEFFSEIYQSSH